jgi:hypothetical protein
VAGLVRQQKRAQVKSASRVQENLARKNWQENLAGKFSSRSRKSSQPPNSPFVAGEQSRRRAHWKSPKSSISWHHNASRLRHPADLAAEIPGYRVIRTSWAASVHADFLAVPDTNLSDC